MVTVDFDAKLNEVRGERPTIRLGGQDFTLRRKVASKRWEKMLAAFSDDDTTVHGLAERLFAIVLVKQDVPRFLALLNLENEQDDDDDEQVIDPAQLNEIVDWVMEYYSGKDSTDSTPSSPGPETTGQPPNVVSLTARPTAS